MELVCLKFQELAWGTSVKSAISINHHQVKIIPVSSSHHFTSSPLIFSITPCIWFPSIVIYIFQMEKLRSREVSNLPKVTQGKWCRRYLNLDSLKGEHMLLISALYCLLEGQTLHLLSPLLTHRYFQYNVFTLFRKNVLGQKPHDTSKSKRYRRLLPQHRGSKEWHF